MVSPERTSRDISGQWLLGVKLDQMRFHFNGRDGKHTGRLHYSCQDTSMTSRPPAHLEQHLHLKNVHRNSYFCFSSLVISNQKIPQTMRPDVNFSCLKEFSRNWCFITQQKTKKSRKFLKQVDLMHAWNIVLLLVIYFSLVLNFNNSFCLRCVFCWRPHTPCVCVCYVMQMWGSQSSAWQLAGRPHTPQHSARISESCLLMCPWARRLKRKLTCLIYRGLHSCHGCGKHA